MLYLVAFTLEKKSISSNFDFTFALPVLFRKTCFIFYLYSGLKRRSSLKKEDASVRPKTFDRPKLQRGRSNSLPDEVIEDRNDETEAEVEIMRQFVAKNKKIINRGDSVRLVLFESFNHVHVDTRCFVN